MRNRGKREVETYNNNEPIVDNTNNNNNNNYINNNGYYGEGFMEFPCKKHPTSPSTSTGGICAYCLTDRLYQLVCPQCGELSNTCSCTQSFSFNNNNNSNNSSSYGDVGNVGRISFLLENDKVVPNNNNVDFSSSRPRLVEQRSRASFSSNVDDHNNYRPTLRRSNSTCVSDLSYAPTSSNSTTSTNIGRKESSKDKFWKIGRLFRKKKDKSHNNNNNNNNYNTNYNNTNVSNDQENNSECTGVPRSRSLSSFRGFNDTEESGNFPISSSAARASSVSTGNFYADSAKQSCFSESEARMSNFDSYFDPSGFNKNNNSNNNIFSVKETEFVSDEDPAYIDLKLHNMSSSSSDYHHSNNNYNNRVPDLGTLRRSGLGMSSTKEFSYRGSNYNENDDVFGNDQMLRNSSCRRSSVTERELRKCRKSSKVLKWFFKNQSSSRDNDQDDLHHHGFN